MHASLSVYFFECSDQWRKVSVAEWSQKKLFCYTPIPGSRVAVVCYDNRLNNSRIERLKQRNAQYCANHGYDFLFFSTHAQDNHMPPYWLKVQIVKEVLETNKYDYVMWIDSDACFWDANIAIERIFKVFGLAYHFFVAGPDILDSFNAGVWIVKNCVTAKEFMIDWIQCYKPEKWIRLKEKWKCLGLWAGKYFEQGAGKQLLKTDKYKYGLLWLNGVLNCQIANVNTFVCHFYGPSMFGVKKRIDKVPIDFRRKQTDDVPIF